MVLGKCPACGGDLRIRSMRGQSQFIGCSNYPQCTFNINLPGPQWGKAIRTTTTCAEHGLCHTRLIRKGVKPWDLGCPLCKHISSNLEALKMIPHLTEELIRKLHARHVYTVSEVAASAPEGISDILEVNAVEALDIIRDAKVVLVLLRKRSDLRSFVRKHLPPRKGRSISTLMGRLFASEINDVRDLSRADTGTLKAAGISETEAKNLLEAVLGLCNERILRESGIPPGSLKKYREAGITKPEDFFSLPAEAMGTKAGIRTETVRRHIEKLSAVTGKKPLRG
jgi:DNA topoisomerase-1